MDPEPGAPSDPLEGGDTQENRVHELDDADIVEIDSGAVTKVTRICSECLHEVMGIPVTEPPTIDVLRLPIYWKGCVYSGPGEFPCWWFCCRGGKAEAKPGTNGGILGVTGAYRVRVERMVTLT